MKQDWKYRCAKIGSRFFKKSIQFIPKFKHKNLYFSLPNTVLVKLPSGETKKTTLKQGQVEVTKLTKPTPSGSTLKTDKPDQKTDRKEVSPFLFHLTFFKNQKSLYVRPLIKTNNILCYFMTLVKLGQFFSTISYTKLIWALHQNLKL